MGRASAHVRQCDGAPPLVAAIRLGGVRQQGVKEQPGSGRHRRQRVGRLVVVLRRNHVVVGHVRVGQGAVPMGAGDHSHAAVFDGRLVDGEPAAAQLHGPDRPVGRVLVHALGRAHLRRLEQHRVAKHLDVRPKDAAQYADHVGVAPERLEPVVRLHQPVDLADAVAGMRDAQLAAGDARLGLHLDLLLRTPTVRVLAQPFLQSRQFRLRDQVLYHDKSATAVVGKLLVGQVDRRRGAGVLCHCHHGLRVGAGRPRGKPVRRVRAPTQSQGINLGSSGIETAFGCR